jgi:hypothetical protein
MNWSLQKYMVKLTFSLYKLIISGICYNYRKLTDTTPIWIMLLAILLVSITKIWYICSSFVKQCILVTNIKPSFVKLLIFQNLICKPMFTCCYPSWLHRKMSPAWKKVERISRWNQGRRKLYSKGRIPPSSFLSTHQKDYKDAFKTQRTATFLPWVQIRERRKRRGIAVP